MALAQAQVMERFCAWLAASPLASAFKVAASAALMWCVDNATTFDLPPVVQVALIAGLPVLINALNPADSRYGFGAQASE